MQWVYTCRQQLLARVASSRQKRIMRRSLDDDLVLVTLLFGVLNSSANQSTEIVMKLFRDARTHLVGLECDIGRETTSDQLPLVVVVTKNITLEEFTNGNDLGFESIGLGCRWIWCGAGPDGDSVAIIQS